MTLSFGSPVGFLRLPISGLSDLGTCMQIAPIVVEQKPLKKRLLSSRAWIVDGLMLCNSLSCFEPRALLHGILQR